MTDDLFIVASFATPIEAHILRTRLEAEGIPCLIANEHVVNANPLWSNALGGVQVQVRREDAELAAEIMRDIA